jgi:hypothetical protein
MKFSLTRFGTLGSLKRSMGVFIPGTPGTPAPSSSVPDAPTLAVSPGTAQNSISWTDGANGGSAITGHKLYRSTSAGFTPSGANLVGTIMTGSPYLDTGITNGTTYYYRLSAVNSVGESGLSPEASGKPILQVLVDTDFIGDFDDPISIAVMARHIAAGAAAPVAYVTSAGGTTTTTNPTTTAVNILANKYAAPAPAYAFKGTTSTGGYALSYNDGGFASAIKTRFASGNISTSSSGSPVAQSAAGRGNYIDDVTGYRTVLAAAGANSITICLIGAPTAFARFLASPADGISTLTGQQLLAAKVAKLVVMGGNFSVATAEYNAGRDIDATLLVSQVTSVPVYWTDFNQGETVLSGPPGFTDPTVDPVAYAMDIYWTNTPSGLTNGRRKSYDPLALDYAARGAGDRWIETQGSVAAPIATFSASISGTTMTVSAMTAGTIQVGMLVTAATGVSGSGSGTIITAQTGGPVGGAGTYTVTNSQTVTERAMAAGGLTAFTPGAGNHYRVTKSGTAGGTDAALGAMLDGFVAAVTTPIPATVKGFAMPLNETSGQFMYDPDYNGARLILGGNPGNTTNDPARLTINTSFQVMDFNGTAQFAETYRPDGGVLSGASWAICVVATPDVLTGTMSIAGLSDVDAAKGVLQLVNGVPRALAFTDASGAGVTSVTALDPGAAMAAGTYELLTAWSDGATLRLRRGGAQVASVAVATPHTGAAGRCTIGYNRSGTGSAQSYFDGKAASWGMKAVAGLSDVQALETLVRGYATAKGITLP